MAAAVSGGLPAANICNLVHKAPTFVVALYMGIVRLSTRPLPTALAPLKDQKFRIVFQRA